MPAGKSGAGRVGAGTGAVTQRPQLHPGPTSLLRHPWGIYSISIHSYSYILIYLHVLYISSRNKGNILYLAPPATSCTPKPTVPQHLPLPLQTAASHLTYFLSGVLRPLFEDAFGVLPRNGQRFGVLGGYRQRFGVLHWYGRENQQFCVRPHCSPAPHF